MSNTAATSTVAPAVTSSAAERLTIPSTTLMDAERITFLDFWNDPERDGDRGSADSWGDEYRIGRDAPAGWWSWGDASADDCVYIAIMPTWVFEPSDADSYVDVDRDEIDRLVWLDAREALVLVMGEAIVGYAANADIAELVPGGCAEEVGQGGLWECRAHSGPEPVELLDWRTEYDKPHADVSCRVGVGIRAGWWQWHSFSAVGCRSVAVRPSATAELPDGQSRSRRDAREPIVLNDDDVVTGFTFVNDASSPDGVVAATESPLCLLEFLGAERRTSP